MAKTSLLHTRLLRAYLALARLYCINRTGKRKVRKFASVSICSL